MDMTDAMLQSQDSMLQSLDMSLRAIEHHIKQIAKVVNSTIIQEVILMDTEIPKQEGKELENDSTHIDATTMSSQEIAR
ncbi:hypothetical protein V6N13_130727 [Hibiscus sabdariffa]|uniref:Uncharacterized protein n=1 Tax=Hibiscus sabdariffa TaxID=183260 RepID=A0ABR2BQT5_9ROSI